MLSISRVRVATISAAYDTPKANPLWDRFQRRLDERRTVLESARSMNVKRLRGDMERVMKKELEFTRKLVEEIIPVHISWNEEAWNKIQEHSPIRVQPLHEEVAPSASAEKAIEPDTL